MKYDERNAIVLQRSKFRNYKNSKLLHFLCVSKYSRYTIIINGKILIVIDCNNTNNSKRCRRLKENNVWSGLFIYEFFRHRNIPYSRPPVKAELIRTLISVSFASSYQWLSLLFSICYNTFSSRNIRCLIFFSKNWQRSVSWSARLIETHSFKCFKVIICRICMSE